MKMEVDILYQSLDRTLFGIRAFMNMRKTFHMIDSKFYSMRKLIKIGIVYILYKYIYNIQNYIQGIAEIPPIYIPPT